LPVYSVFVAELYDAVQSMTKGQPTNGDEEMPSIKSTYKKQLYKEVEAVPEEYLPLLLQMIRTYRESVFLKPAAESFQKGWQEAHAGEIVPLKHLWEGIDGE